MRKIIKATSQLEGRDFRKAIVTALVVGSILTLINQWQALFGPEPFKWLAFVLTYCVPFIVFLWGRLSSLSSAP